MSEPSPEMKTYLKDWQERYAPLVVEYETIIRSAFKKDEDFDPTSPAIVRGVMPRENGGFRIVHGSAIPTGRAPASIPGAWMPDRQLLAQLAARTMECRSARWMAAERRVPKMPASWTDVLRRRWPGQFECELSIGPGWVDLLIATHTWLVELGVDEFRWSQVKEKLGGARFYHSAGQAGLGDVGCEVVEIAESVMSYCLCDQCGAPGRWRNDHGWYSTRCDEHAPGRKQS